MSRSTERLNPIQDNVELGHGDRGPRMAGETLKNSGSGLKRRKIRKGTSSCWECKHRKKRCEFRPISNLTCVFCQYHNLACGSQDSPDPTGNKGSDAENIAQRIDHVEALITRLVNKQQQQQQPAATKKSFSFVLSKRSEGKDYYYPKLSSVSHEALSRGPSLAGFLYSVLPDPSVAIVILSSSKLFRSPLQISQMPLSGRSGLDEVSGDLPLSPFAHPILLARRLIQLALCLRYFDAKSCEKLELFLKGSVTDVSCRYFNLASQLVMAHDELIGSVEGLENLMLQALYHISAGDLQSAWSLHRRASNIASQMGLSLLAETAGSRAESVWFRLVYSDRFLSFARSSIRNLRESWCS
ncbi:hypothetical protein N7462_005584 [Penicillium macrosclerotiorum]|uniref:uncharacterized protein n=1 Tax=Penicillium macrosclerotiorum TaxID=303699 RepID=UPI002547CD22|nr:uncharacterized protein N7462_005584 [Penicillium macrosclerotiorum]KAJ5682419.1 hypothetical protein N7462_005584 [Penicillium macrosclerotiorum]